MFMLVGYETTSTALTYCTFILATQIEEQNKLRAEIDQYYSNTAVINTFKINILHF